MYQFIALSFFLSASAFASCNPRTCIPQDVQTIRCQEGQEVGFDQKIRPGFMTITTKNISLVRSNLVKVSVDPIFHLTHFNIETAYCLYYFALENNDVLFATRTCEGEETKLNCEM